MSHMSEARRTPRFNGDRVQALCNRFCFRRAMPGCTKSNRDLEDAWEKLKRIPYSVCLLGGCVSSFLVFFDCFTFPTFTASQNITDTQTFPRIRFHLLIDGFSVGSQSPANLFKCQATLISSLPLNILSFVQSD